MLQVLLPKVRAQPHDTSAAAAIAAARLAADRTSAATE
jgi:hypothetical protein